MLAQFHNRRFYFVLAADLAIFVAAFVGAFLLRFDFTLTPFYQGMIARLSPFLFPGKILIFFLFGMYRGMWRFSGMRDLISLVQAVTISSGLAMTLLFLAFRLEEYPRSVFIIDWFVVLVLAELQPELHADRVRG